MKTPQKTLWKLIKRMTPAEKRYFKSHFASVKNRHTLLFDAFNKQLVHDEEAIRDEMEIDAKQFKVVKSQLRELVFKSLVSNGSKKTALSKLRIGLEEVDILLTREMFVEASQRLQKLLVISKIYGYSLYQYEIRERLHSISFLELDSTDSQAAVHQEKLDVLTTFLQHRQQLNRMRLELEEWNIFMEGREESIRDMWQQLDNMQVEKLDLPASLSWLLNAALCQEILGEPSKASMYRNQAASIFKGRPELRKELGVSYLSVLKSFAFLNSWNPEMETIDDLCSEAQQVVQQYPQHAPHYIYFLWARLRGLFILRKFDAIIDELEPLCMAHLEKYQLENYRISANIHIVLANTYLILNKPPKVQFYIRQFRNNRVQVEKELQLTVNIMELISHWETNDLNLINNRLAAFKRARNAEDQQKYLLYELHLDVFRKLADEPYNSALVASEMLLQIPEYQNDPIFKYYTFQNLERWLQAVAVNKPLSEILKA